MDRTVKGHKVHDVGDGDNPDAEVVRVVHISDTHMHHDRLILNIPDGDILVHSGDFSCFSLRKFCRSSDHKEVMREANLFFEKLPHRHKIFVAGNHEVNFEKRHREELQSFLPNALYLQDSSATVEGIHFYGAPWNVSRMTSFANGFAKNQTAIAQCWDSIPEDTDVLVTHMPPRGVLDLASQRYFIERLVAGRGVCKTCGKYHHGFGHWGCLALRDAIFLETRAKLHLFGHVHECNGVEKIGNITFSNAAMHFTPTANVFDFYKNPNDSW
ncbi:hypothetical protein ScPMuIL_006806 [Solemya velum]